MKLFNIDCHVSVIADLKKIFEDLNHQVTSWSISGHNWIFNREPSKVDVVNQHNWMRLDKNMCDSFYERYKDELSKYDAFICTYPPSFALLYEKFNKPIIIQIPIRYEVPFHNNEDMWNYFNEYLRNKIDDGKIIPVANSEYDKKYFEFFVNRECELIPNICEYTNATWNPTIDNFLYSSRLPIKFDKNITDKATLFKYEWQDIMNYKGIIIIPYNCSTMSIFEYYTSNIPIFCPSKDFMKELYKKHQNYVLSELTWNKIFDLPSGSIINCEKSNDPNNYNDFDIINNWIDFSDFYNIDWMPHIIYFNSFDDLTLKLKNTDLKDVSMKMSDFNKIRKIKIYDMWNKILNKINE
jgi:hypothetical protein